MITTETTLQQLSEATETMTGMIHPLSERLFNAVPFEGSWTAGQLLQHMIKSDSSILGGMKGDTVPTTGRIGDEHISELEETFLDSGRKFNAPDFIVPEAVDYDKNELLAAFKKGREEIAGVLRSTNPLDTCMAHPIFAGYTRLEMVSFITVHTIRHTRQLEKIIAALKA